MVQAGGVGVVVETVNGVDDEDDCDVHAELREAALAASRPGGSRLQDSIHQRVEVHRR